MGSGPGWDQAAKGAGCQVASGPGGTGVPNGSRVGNRAYRPVKFSDRLVCLQIVPALALAAAEQVFTSLLIGVGETVGWVKPWARFADGAQIHTRFSGGGGVKNCGSLEGLVTAPTK